MDAAKRGVIGCVA
jgi:hypothetical protein